MNTARRFKKKLDVSYARYLKSKRADRFNEPGEQSYAEKHTARVAFLKKFIMRMVVLLVILLIVWPLANRHWDSKISFGGATDKKTEDNNLPVMLKPKFFGNDNDGQPYHLNAVSGVSVNSNKVVLNDLNGDMISKQNSKVNIASHHGDYSVNEKILVLNDGVVLNTDNGYEFTTNSAAVKLNENMANGTEKVNIKGPLGDIEAKGFIIRDSGNEIVLFGGVDLNATIPQEDIDKANEVTTQATDPNTTNSEKKDEKKSEKNLN